MIIPERFHPHGRIDLAERLDGYWCQDHWLIAACPLVKNPRMTANYPKRTLRFDALSPTVAGQLKYAIREKFERCEWDPNHAPVWSHLLVMFRWLAALDPPVESLAERSLKEWEASFVAYITTHHLVIGDGHYLAKLRETYRIIIDAYDERTEEERDVWDVRRLGHPGSPTRCLYTLNFTRITQPWLRQLAKRYCHYSLTTCSISHALGAVTTLNHFSSYLSLHHPRLEPSELNRSMIEGFLAYLCSHQQISDVTRYSYIVSLRSFLTLCLTHGWAPIAPTILIYDEDLPRYRRGAPRFIPEEVIAQLIEHSADIPVHVRRMILVLMECGLRIGELLTIKLDCLVSDSRGGWFLQYYQGKMKKDHRVPISKELAAVIEQQQADAHAKCGDGVTLLFPNRQGKSYSYHVVETALKKLAKQHDIRTAAGQLWNFQSHQFRHTVAKRMINNKVPLHIVQKFLGHESPRMTLLYAHILDETLKKEIAEFRATYLVDIYGHTVAATTEADTAELQWFKHHIDGRTLPIGYCGIPRAAAPCPHPNACLTCPHLRTDRKFPPVLIQQREETTRVKEVAKRHGWTMQYENNDQIEKNLDRMINTLERPEEGALNHGSQKER